MDAFCFILEFLVFAEAAFIDRRLFKRLWRWISHIVAFMGLSSSFRIHNKLRSLEITIGFSAKALRRLEIHGFESLKFVVIN